MLVVLSRMLLQPSVDEAALRYIFVFKIKAQWKLVQGSKSPLKRSHLGGPSYGVALVPCVHGFLALTKLNEQAYPAPHSI